MTDGLDRKIELMVAAEVEKQLNRERTILKDAGGIALKIVAGAFIVLIAIFTVFGLTTWKDVKRETAEFIKIRADELIQKNDADTGVKQTLNDLVNRAIVSSQLIAIRSESKTDFELPKNEWDRLRNWLKFENLDNQEFSDVLTILNAQTDERKKSDANGLLSEMLNPSDNSPYQWIKKQPAKRLAIMASFEQLDMGGPALEIAGSPHASQEMRTTAVKYLKSIKYTEGFDKLIRLASSTEDEDLKVAALITSSALRPTDSRLGSEIDKLISQSKPRSSSLMTVLHMTRQIIFNDEGSEGEAERITTAKRLLKFAFDHGVYITQEGSPAIDPRRPENRLIFWVPSGTSRASGFSFGTLANLNEFKPYWILLTEAANSNDLPALVRLLPRNRVVSRTGFITLQLKASKDSSILVQDEGGNQRNVSGEMQHSIVSSQKRLAKIQTDLFLVDSERGISNEKIVRFSGNDFEFTGAEIYSAKAKIDKTN